MALLLALIVCLALAGGASRADALGQAIVRLAAAAALAGLILSGARPRPDRWPTMILIAAAALPLMQLIPLPPSIWPLLPGRASFLEAAAAAGAAQPWRPLALSPDAAWNAFFSFLAPAAALLLTATLDEDERTRLPGVVFALAAVSAVVAVVQLSGSGLDNPLINETVGTASGIFANANHQALLLALGIVAAAAWAEEPTSASGRRRTALWRVPVAGGAAVWFLLMIMASGSRTGLVLGFLALAVAAAIARRALGAMLARAPRPMRWVLAGAGLTAILALGVVSFTAGRAVSLNRLLVLSTGEDMRSRALPTVLDMISTYMPFGSGFGSFDPLFRMHEPDALLNLSYFNHAHNDYLEVALEGGIPAVLLVIAALGWALRVGVAAWRADPSDRSVPAARFGATAMLLIALASVVDYPARTPAMMALLAISAVLANAPGRRAKRVALRSGTEPV